MRAQFKVSNKLIIDVDAPKQKDLFKCLASAQEVFGEECCGLCGSKNIGPIWRTSTKVEGKKVETFEFPEWKCFDCPGRLAMGTINDDTGTLYPIRKLSPETGLPVTKEESKRGVQGVYGKSRGWHKWQKKGGGDDE